MSRTRIVKAVLAGVLSWAVFAGQARAQSDAPGSLKSASSELAECKADLLKQLEGRLQEASARGPCQDFLLRFDEGADGETMNVTAFHRGGQWAGAFATVPIWSHESILEKRNVYHRNNCGWIMRDRYRFAADVGGLAVAGDKLEGRLDAVIGLNRTREHRMPPGTATVFRNTGEVFSWIDRWTYLVHEKPRYQAYHLSGIISKDTHELQLVLRKAIFNSSDIYITFRMPDTAWFRPTPWTPTLCAGFHNADLSGLTFKDGTLSGTIKMKINPDPWGPKAPVPGEFKMTGRLENGYFAGRYEVVGDAKQSPGVIEGRGGLLVTGSYTAKGDLGTYGSEFTGIAVPARVSLAKPAALLEDPKPSGDSAQDLARQLSALYHQVRALDMALRQYPLPIEDALRQTVAPEPQWTAETAKDIPAYCQAMIAQVKALPAGKDQPSFVRGIPDMPDAAFGPFYGSSALANGQTGFSCSLPADAGKPGPQRWAFVPEWEVAGPFEAVDDTDHNYAELPDVIPGGGAAYTVNHRLLPKEQQPKAGEAVVKGWARTACGNGKLTPGWLPPTLRSHFRGTPWFARAVVESPADQKLWISLATMGNSKLWVNGRLAYVSGEIPYAYRREQEAIFPLALRKGSNELLIRGRDDRGESWVRLHLCVQGSPRSAEESAASAASAPAPAGVTVVGARGDGGGRFAQANPPLAWDFESGANIAWKQALTGKRFGGPVAVAGKLFLSVAPASLVCLSQADGKQLWSAQVDLTGAADAKPADTGQDVILADARQVWVHHRSGIAAAYDHAGKQKWIAPSGIPNAQAWVEDGKLLLDGATRVKNESTHRTVALDAATGKDLWKQEKSGYQHAGIIRVSGKGKALTALLVDGMVLDLANGKGLLSGIDIDATPQSVVTIDGDMIFWTALHQKRAARFVLDDDGQIGCRQAWNNEYAYKESTRPVQAVAADRWFFTSATVQEDRKGHSPCPGRELNIFDRVTGEPVGRLKCLYWQSEMDGTPPTMAGNYLFVQDGGGGSAGGSGKNGQMAVVGLPPDRSGLPCHLSTSLLPMGSSVPPVFEGGRMFLVSGTDVHCIGAGTSEAAKFQDEQLATDIIARLGTFEGDGSVRKVCQALEQRPDTAKVPLARMGDEPGIIKWLRAGPVALKDDPATLAALASLRAEVSSTLEIGEAKAKFAPLPHLYTGSQGIVSSYHLLEGFGMQVIEESREVALGKLIGPDAKGWVVLYTVVANSRPRYVSVVAPEAEYRMWLGGKRVKSASAVHVGPGYYPLVVCVEAESLAKAPNVRVSFQGADEPGAVKLGRAAKVGPYQAWLESLQPSADLAKKLRQILQDLRESRAMNDALTQTRGDRADGSARFCAEPPVPMTKMGNLQWSYAPAKGFSTAPVAAGGLVFIGANPAGITALNAADGEKAKPVWTVEFPEAGDGPISAPAVCLGRVAVASANGNVLCCTLEGRKLWTAKVSPAADKKAPAILPTGNGFVIQTANLSALDAATGKPAWAAEIPLAAGSATAKPAIALIHHVPVIFTAGGLAARATDGAVLARNLPASGAISPHLSAGVLYVAKADSVVAVALPALPVQGAAFKTLWSSALADGPLAQPVARDGLLYVLTVRGLHVLNAADGKQERLQPLDAPATARSELVLTGSHLHITNLGTNHGVLVFKTSPKLEKSLQYGCAEPADGPTFLGNRMFLRAGGALFAMGGDSPGEPATTQEPLAIGSPAGFAPGEGAPVFAFGDNEVPPNWLVSAPLPVQSMEIDFLKDIGGAAKASVAAATTVKYDGQSYAFRALEKAAFWRHAKFTSGLDCLLMKESAGGKDNSTFYLYTVIDVQSPRVAEFQLLTWKAERWANPQECSINVWLSGQPLKSGETVALGKGKHPMMLQVAIGKAGKVWIAPRFLDMTDSFEDLKARTAAQKAIWESYQKSKGEPFVLTPPAGATQK